MPTLAELMAVWSQRNVQRPNLRLRNAPLLELLHRALLTQPPASSSTCKNPPALKQIRPANFIPNGFAFGARLWPKSQKKSPESESQWLRDSSAHLDLRHLKAPITYQLYQG